MVEVLQYDAELRYQYSFGKKNCLIIVGKILFATPGPLSFFFLTTVLVLTIYDHCPFQWDYSSAQSVRKGLVLK